MGKTEQFIVIEAPVDTVWERIRDFHDMSWAPNVISTCTPVGDTPGDEIGAKRLLNDVFHETLLELSDHDRTVRYSIDGGPTPISKSDVRGYEGVVQVTSADGGSSTHVQWNSSWQGNDEAAAEFCHPVYVALLQDLRNTFNPGG
jgi:hypothetical protein